MTPTDPPGAGRADLEHAARELAKLLPPPLAALARLAFNYRWSWLPGGPALFESVDPGRWALCGHNPVRLLQEAPAESLERAARDDTLLARAAAAENSVISYLGRPALAGTPPPERPAAFFCAEYGVHESLPIYSGGLGALAGDLVKQASDDAMPFVAVGLLYRQGYFRQRLDASGWQHEYWTPTDPDRLPAALVRVPDGRPLTITVPIAGTDVVAQIWRVDVGRVPLFLLDAERPENPPAARWITSRLYISDPEIRLAQYVLLGVGGVRMLHALGFDPSVVHLNEGHAAFAALELIGAHVGGGLEGALAAGRQRTVFTTHTPVPAGNDTYSVDTVHHVLGGLYAELGIDGEAVVRLGRSHPDESAEPFGVTQFALRASRIANAVSRRHGEVARSMWQHLWPELPDEQVPIRHVTNGVHVPSWVGVPIARLLERHLGSDWMARAADPATWEPISAIPDAELWAARREQRAELVDYVRERSPSDRLGRGDSPGFAAAAARGFDPDALTIGFARRLATYKRLRLLIEEPENLRLLDGDRPVQVIIAGKAHPRDDDAKRLLQSLFALKDHPAVGRRVVFLDDYDLESAGRLVRGCDVWINLPRPPLEASGTSGMKSVVNGGLHLSVLDGWWAEAFDGSGGWALSGDVDADERAQDARHGAELHRVLADEIVPLFAERDEHGIPTGWLARVRNSMRGLGPAFSAARMLADYRSDIYGW
ncbi:MAG: alpha-glucan family phosphorylase [Solirubrobacteraceae bacterium]